VAAERGIENVEEELGKVDEEESLSVSGSPF